MDHHRALVQAQALQAALQMIAAAHPEALLVPVQTAEVALDQVHPVIEVEKKVIISLAIFTLNKIVLILSNTLTKGCFGSGKL